MLPPERAYKSEPAVQSSATGGGGGGLPAQQKQQQPLSTIQKVVRFAEKDDLLLYITALFGILMPAVMYFFYKTMHSKYHAYQNKRKAAKRRELVKKRSKRTITIFYCGTDSPTKRIAYELAEELDRLDPVVANLSSIDIHRRIQASSKAVFIFIVPTDEPAMPPVLMAFLDWMDEMRYEHRQKALLRGTSFAVFGLSFAGNNPSEYQKVEAASILHAKLQSMQGLPMHKAAITANYYVENEVEKKLKEFSTELASTLRQFQYGAFDDKIGANDDENSSDEAHESDAAPSTADESVSTDSDK